MKLKYLRHPFRTFSTAKAVLAARLSMRSFASYGRRRFKGDDRYDLQSVTEGFKSRLDDYTDDTELLQRICTAYIKAVERQEFAPDAYEATEWWAQIRETSLVKVRQALLTRDTEGLQRMYRNFYRDSCSAGLLGVPYGMTKAYFGGAIKDVHRHFYLSHILRRLDCWMDQTDRRFAVSDLAGPQLGNPFGIQLGETLVCVSAEHAHYCAQAIGVLCGSGPSIVAEIGGGFGGMAYYLLRDHPNVTYLDFDVPESIALSSYYLMKAFPRLEFLLFGEGEITRQVIDDVDVALMPAFEMDSLPAESVDVCFSSHAMSDLSPGAVDVYMNNIARATRKSFMYVGKQSAGELVSGLVRDKYDDLMIDASRPTGWYEHQDSGAVGGAELAASVMCEQYYMRATALRGQPG